MSTVHGNVLCCGPQDKPTWLSQIVLEEILPGEIA